MFKFPFVYQKIVLCSRKDCCVLFAVFVGKEALVEETAQNDKNFSAQ